MSISKTILYLFFIALFICTAAVPVVQLYANGDGGENAVPAAAAVDDYEPQPVEVRLEIGEETSGLGNITVQQEHIAQQEHIMVATLDAQPDEQPDESADRSIYKLGTDDKIQVIVYGEKDLSGNFRVDSSGQVSFPLVGEVTVEGMTARELENVLEAMLADGYLVDPSVSVEITHFRPFYILGEVRAPGSYSYISDMSVLNAVALAGGFTYRADRDEVEILRAGRENSAMFDDIPVNTKIVPGDIILVKERFF